MEAQHIVDRFVDIAGEVKAAIDQVPHWGPSGRRSGQYTIDVSADEVAVSSLVASGFGVMSEESGVTHANREVMVIVDPIDGSTNAAAGLPWYASSFCAVDATGPLASVVVNHATGDRWSAIRGSGAARNATPLHLSSATPLNEAIVAVSGLPAQHLGWRQFRCYGAAALDICAVADGTFDAFIDLSFDAHGSWDYLGAMLVLKEAGGSIVDYRDRPLLTRDHDARRTPVAASNDELLSELVLAAQRVGGSSVS